MTLTKENMKTDPKIWSIKRFREDVINMNDGQLERYLTMAFTGQTDYDFLPISFWEDYFITYGNNCRQPGEFFARLFVNSSDELENRFEAFLKKIMQECINYNKKPTKKEIMFAYFAVQAVDYIFFSKGPNSPGEQFVDFLEKEGTTTIGKAREFAKTIQYPSIDSDELYNLADKIKEDSRYSNINFATNSDLSEV